MSGLLICVPNGPKQKGIFTVKEQNILFQKFYPHQNVLFNTNPVYLSRLIKFIVLVCLLVCMFRSADFTFKAIYIFIYLLRQAPSTDLVISELNYLMWLLRYDLLKVRDWTEKIVFVLKTPVYYNYLRFLNLQVNCPF